MKKLLLALLAIGSLALAGCDDVKGRGNHNIGWGCYIYNYIHVQMPGSNYCFHDKIESWANDDGGIEIKGEHHGYLILGDGTYIMWNKGTTCPICGLDIEGNYTPMVVPTPGE